MSETTISWTDKVWNVTRGCRRVSPGCENCYAERQANWFRGPGGAYEGLIKLVGGKPRWSGVTTFADERLADPLRWRKPCRIFVDSMSDLFYEGFTNEQIAAVFGVMAACPQHTFQVLTKRARRMREWFEWVERTARESNVSHSNPAGLKPTVRCLAESMQLLDVSYATETALQVARAVPWPLPNVWLIVSVEDQERADERIPDLLATPAAVRGLSCEPLLSGLSLERYLRCEHDEGRNGATGTDCDGNLLGGSSRRDLASLPVVERQCAASATADTDQSSGAGRGEGDERVSSRSVHGRRGAPSGLRAPDRLDDHQPPADPSVARGESHRWGQVEQHSVQPRDRDEEGQCSARPPSARAAGEPEISGREADNRTGARDSSSVRRQGTGTRRDREDVQRVGEDGQQDRAPQVVPAHPRISWLIAGCESGPGARPCDVAWLRSLRDQCAAAGVPYFLKQAERQSLDRIVADVDPVAVGDGSRAKGGGVIELPYLDGVQHKEMPRADR